MILVDLLESEVDLTNSCKLGRQWKSHQNGVFNVILSVCCLNISRTNRFRVNICKANIFYTDFQSSVDLNSFLKRREHLVYKWISFVHLDDIMSVSKSVRKGPGHFEMKVNNCFFMLAD